MKALVVIGIDEPLTSIGQTALHIACAAGALPLVMALLKAGANVNAVDKTGASPVALASTAGHAHVLEKRLDSRYNAFLFCQPACHSLSFSLTSFCFESFFEAS